MKITGSVVYQDLEGGFWGIVGDDGHQYEPVDPLPASVQVDGCRIEAEVEPVQRFSFTMWGHHVRVHHVKKL